MNKAGGTTVASSNSVGVGQKKKRARTSKKSATNTTDDQIMTDDNTSTIKICTTMNDDITKVKTAKHCAKQWESLFQFQLRDSKKTTLKSSPSSTTHSLGNNTNNNSTQDVFNCKDLIIPPSHELVNNEVTIGIQRWKDLAARVIVEEDGPTICKTEDDGTTDTNIDNKITLKNEELLLDAATSGDKRKHRLLPYNFDYICKKKRPSNNDTAAEDEDIISGSADDINVNQYHHRPKVISLVDPTQTIDYESELWNVFNSMRTSTELEKIYALGSNTRKKNSSNNPENDNTIDASVDDEEISHGCKHTLAVKQNLVGWIKKNTRLDAHSLGRLRVRDCHANPVSSGIVCPTNGDDQSQLNETTLQTTIRFEILRHSQNLKRASGPDGNRMEVELYGSRHTLLDLHRLLVECSLNASSLKGEKGDCDNNNNIHPGVFFIENNFYTCGDAGARIGVAIKNWCSDKKSDTMEEEELSTHTPRQQHLGISNKINMIPISEMKLEDLPLRLGVRYYHMLVPPPTPLHLESTNVMSLANESAVYVTGIHTHKSNKSTKPSIIIHDTWASPQRHTCLACNYFLASVVTVNDPLTDSSPPNLDSKSNKVCIQGVPLCSSCYRALHYEPANNLDQPQLKLRASSKPILVFPIEEYQRMVTASSLE